MGRLDTWTEECGRCGDLGLKWETIEIARDAGVGSECTEAEADVVRNLEACRDFPRCGISRLVDDACMSCSEDGIYTVQN